MEQQRGRGKPGVKSGGGHRCLPLTVARVIPSPVARRPLSALHRRRCRHHRRCRRRLHHRNDEQCGEGDRAGRQPVDKSVGCRIKIVNAAINVFVKKIRPEFRNVYAKNRFLCVLFLFFTITFRKTRLQYKYISESLIDGDSIFIVIHCSTKKFFFEQKIMGIILSFFFAIRKSIVNYFRLLIVTMFIVGYFT